MWNRRYGCCFSSLKICLLLLLIYGIVRVMGGVMENRCYLGAR